MVAHSPASVGLHVQVVDGNSFLTTGRPEHSCRIWRADHSRWAWGAEHPRRVYGTRLTSWRVTTSGNLNFCRHAHSSNVTFQISNDKYHIEDNPSSAAQQLIQNQVATFNLSNANFTFHVLNFKFHMSNIKCHFSTIKFQIWCRRQPFLCYSSTDSKSSDYL